MKFDDTILAGHCAGHFLVATPSRWESGLTIA